MVFWFVAALLTFGASVAVLLPLTGSSRRDSAGNQHDLAVYRDQLAELDRDAARGLIQPADAEQARAEIARRIIRADSSEEMPAEKAGWSAAGRVLGGVAVLVVPLMSWGLYAALGSPDIPSQPLEARLTQNPADSSVDELIARAEGHLAANPQDGRGWDVLAPIYLRLGRFDQAVTAYKNAIRLEGASAAREAGLGEALTNAGGGIVSSGAQQAFERALVLEPAQPKARFFLAVALLQDGKSAEAIKAWETMGAELPEGSPWREPVAQALAEAQSRIAATEAKEPAAGPTQAEMDAAASMSSGDRKAMIETMVAGLDQKLRENPQDTDGWMRLVRSYVVLGKTQEARSALGRGLEALGAATENGRKLTEFSAGLGIPVSE
ncbi:c-type cytochrome biogenesis protein CcmI [Pseudaminobacter arsenicus]|uniref:C-type cytochrome biogenesis protein CcmI n=1 Tax=Borborobacter arsenicus TaxID=1851146 RepID=A0A432V596_9HYPH|nr:c-type cytochrome biogenesis protein CcmI [Pseudaminobacter arsenicus]RUM97324.1 c-type cytochrome biogenesis protein CcmI [Pseudaminobacter arsenicus]